MRELVSLVLFLMIAGIAVFGLTVALDPSKTYELFASLSGSETIDSRESNAFVPPKGKFRIYFPAKKPGELTEMSKFLRQTPLPCPQYYVADRDVGYFATEFPADLSNVARAGQGFAPKENASPDDPIFFAAAQTGAVLAPTPVGNNEAIARYGLDPLAVQTFIDGKCAELIDAKKGTITNKFPAALGGGAFPGRYVEGTFKNTQNAFRMRLFLDQRTQRIVCVAVVGKTKRVYSPHATKFLNSLDMWSS
ncbi:MAG: hypothetical protein JST89_05785 [Cyanobacteria bacterium SZAS-4]|nr:hypothetical protein [Cyanobacteria bacterium SZAS-4]